MLHFGSHSMTRWLVLLCGGLLPAIVGCQAASGWAYNNSGRAYYQRGNYAMARDEFHRAMVDDPQNPDYRHNLAMALKKSGDAPGAERILRQNLTTVSAMHQPSYHSLSQMLAEQNRHAEAQDLLQGWTVAQPYVPEAHVEMAWLQREMGNSAGAEQSLRHALQVDPRHPTAMAQLGQLYQDNGQPDRAAAMYQRSLATRWEQPQVQSRLKMIADGSSRNVSTTRSAMLLNPMTMQPASVVYAGPTPLANQQAPAMMMSQPPNAVPAVMAAAPQLGSIPDAGLPGQPGPSGMISTPPQYEQPLMAGPVLMPNADPAHAQPEMTAELPVVDPY